MPKLFSINSKQIGIIITLAILLFLGASYFLIYVPNNEKAVQERHFRSLQNIDNNIHAKISNDTSLINNLLLKYTDTASLRHFITKNKYADSLSVSQANSAPKGKKSAASTSANIDNAESVNDAQNTFTLSARRSIPHKPYAIQVNDELSIDHFIGPLLPADIFDNYIVFYEKDASNVKVYETFRSGLNCHSDSLLEKKNGIELPGIRSLTIGGTEYEIFSQPVNLLGQRWIISGLVSSKNYQQEKNQLPLGILLLLLTAAIGIIMCIPWIKLYHMGNKDKLTVRDGVAITLVSMVLMSLLFFVAFKYNFTFGIFQKRYFPEAKDTLAKRIINSFDHELSKASQILSDYDQYGQNSPYRGRNITLERTDAHYVDFYQVYWISTRKKTEGDEICNWIWNISIPPGTNFKTRDYFANIRDNKPNTIRFVNIPTEKGATNKKRDTAYCYLSQNISKASGAFTSVLAKKSIADSTVVAMGFCAQTLDHVIMPDGYQFAIVDANGEVRYHSRSEFNLNQNLKTEFADSSELISSLEAKSDTSFNAEYFGKRYNIKIKPFPNLPYYVVILENLEYNDTRDMEAYAFTLSMLLCLLVFLIIELGVILLTSSKRSFFKKQLFETSWIGPKISSHRQYNLGIIVNIMIIVLMVIYMKSIFGRSFSFIKTSFLEYIFIILFSIILTSVVLNGVFVWKYYKDKSYKLWYKVRAMLSLLVFIALVNLVAFRTLYRAHFGGFVLYEVISVCICAALVFIMPGALAGLQRFKINLPVKWVYTHSFALMATTRLIITSGIPVAFFFIYAYDYEQNLDTRYRQYHFADQMVQKNAVNNVVIGHLKKGTADTAGVYNDGLSIDSLKIQSDTNSIKKLTVESTYWRENYFTADVLNAFRFQINDVEVRNSNMSTPTVSDVAFFNKLTSEKGQDTVTRTYYKLDPKRYLELDSYNANYSEPNWVFLFTAVFIFFIVIHKVIRKLFALDLPVEDGWDEVNEGLLTNNNLNKLLLIVGSPGSGKLARLKKMIAERKLLGNKGERLVISEDSLTNNVFIADMILIPTADSEDSKDTDIGRWKDCVNEALKNNYSLVIINHLEYYMKDAQTNNMKLDLLEKLMVKGKSKIMIISTVHPVSFLDSYNQQIRQSNKKLSADSKADNSLPENELERWQVLFGHFRIVIEPLENDGKEEVLPLRKEVEYSHFLRDMSAIIPENILDDPEKIGLQSDSMIFKLQLTSQYFYTYIWQSLTMEEKFLLYDLAEDGLVNSYDDYNLSMLVSKKLIINADGTLMLFNKGFRNFILTAIGETEVNRIKDQVKANGNWDSLKTPLVITMLAILAFLFTSQQEAYSRIITYVTAFSAGIPAILKVFSLFGGSSQKSS